MKMTEEVATTQVACVLSYVQGGVAEAWKDNLLDELTKGELEVETAEQLFSKIRNDFGEMSVKERKIEQLQTIEQGGRTCNEYVQEFKKIARGSSYERRPLIKEFKRGLNGAIRRKLAKAEKLLSTMREWQERVVRLDRNQRQSRAKERMLGVTNFIWPYLHQFFIYSHSLNGYKKPLKRPFDEYQSQLKEINNGQDIRQIN